MLFRSMFRTLLARPGRVYSRDQLLSSVHDSQRDISDRAIERSDMCVCIPMFGMIGRMRATPGKRADLIAILSEGTGTMPGCLHYIIMEDVAEPDAIWITEVWDSEASHKASLQLPVVQAAIAKGRPLIAGFDLSSKTTPVSGV